MTDGQGRVIDYLRVSVTDRCNLRCVYCMPPQGVEWMPHDAILTYEQLLRLCGLFAQLGVRRIRLTGGEPLARKGLDSLVRGLKSIDGIHAVALTTNGTLLADQLPGLTAAGLDGVNISLDTLDRMQFAAMTRRDALDAALTGLEAALKIAPGIAVKLNCVPTTQNIDQLVPLAGLAKARPLAVRFIELMPIGQGGGLPSVGEDEIRTRLERAYGPLLPCEPDPGGGPCRYFRAQGFRGKIGFISAVTHQFCATCNRVRLTAAGYLKTCLQYDRGVDLKALLNAGADDDALLAAMVQAIAAKPVRHHFGEAAQGADETLNMNQIGG